MGWWEVKGKLRLSEQIIRRGEHTHMQRKVFYHANGKKQKLSQAMHHHTNCFCSFRFCCNFLIFFLSSSSSALTADKFSEFPDEGLVSVS